MFPGEAAKQNRDAAALFRLESTLDRAVEMLRLVKPGNLT
jgi:hypothetical protein